MVQLPALSVALFPLYCWCCLGLRAFMFLGFSTHRASSTSPAHDSRQSVPWGHAPVSVLLISLFFRLHKQGPMVWSETAPLWAALLMCPGPYIA